MGLAGTIAGLWLIYEKIKEMQYQIKELWALPYTLDPGIKLDKKAVKYEIYKKFGDLFLKFALHEDPFRGSPGRNIVFEQKSTFSTEDVLRIFKYYLSPKEKIVFLSEIAPLLAYPIIKTYEKRDAGPESIYDQILPFLDILLQIAYPLLDGKR